MDSIVKPLEWRANPDHSEGGEIAVGIFGVTYHATDDGWSVHRTMNWTDASSLKAAKAAAQTQYDAGVTAAIDFAAVARIVQAAVDQANSEWVAAIHQAT